jgi:hypothetical protein
MMNEFMKNKNGNNLVIVIFFISLATGLFLGYALQRKNANTIEIGNLEANIANLKQQINVLESKASTPPTDVKYLKTFQIYKLVEESANNSQIAIKSFATDKKTNNLGISLIGNFPNVINFFQYLWPERFIFIKEIEIKSNNQDPKNSTEILLKITVPTVKGAKKP